MGCNYLSMPYIAACCIKKVLNSLSDVSPNSNQWWSELEETLVLLLWKLQQFRHGSLSNITTYLNHCRSMQRHLHKEKYNKLKVKPPSFSENTSMGPFYWWFACSTCKIMKIYFALLQKYYLLNPKIYICNISIVVHVQNLTQMCV